MDPVITIREYIVALLKGSTTAGDNVFGTLVDGLDDGQIPGIVVKARKEVVKQRMGEEPVEYQMTLLLRVSIATSGDEDAAILLCRQVRELLLRDYKLGGLSSGMSLQETDLEPDATGEKVYWDGMILINVDYIATYE